MCRSLEIKYRRLHNESLELVSISLFFVDINALSFTDGPRDQLLRTVETF